MAIRQVGKNKYQLVVDYYDDSGKRRRRTKTITCNGKKEARARLAEFEASWDDKLPSSLTVGQLVKDYIDSREIKGAKANTLKGYNSILRRLNEDVGGLSARDLTTYQIEKYVTTWVKDCGLSPKTINNTVSLLRSSYKRAIRGGLLSRNPCDNVELPKLIKPDIKTFSEEELNVFVDALQDTDLDFKVICELALFCGLRRGEIMGLTVKDIDMISGSIRVDRVRYFVDREAVVELPKTDRSKRVVACPQFILDDIRALVLEHMEHSDSEFLIQYMGEPMKPDYASNRVIKFIERLGLSHVTLHGLRHTFATVLNASGEFDLADISSALGHSNITTTMNIYVDVFGGASRASKRISESFERKYGRAPEENTENGAKMARIAK